MDANALEKIEEQHTNEKNQDKSKVCLQLVASVIVNLTFLSAGICYAWPTIYLPQLENAKSDLHLTSDLGGWVTTALPIGACIGPIASALLLDRIGRKWLLYLTTIPIIVCWVLTYLAKSWIELFVARLVSGISIGSIFTSAPVYLGELVDAKIRGASGVLTALSLNVGILIMYGVGPLVDRKIMALLSLAPSVIFLLLAPWIPESPYYYLKKKRERSAELALIWLRRYPDNKHIIKEINQQIEDEKDGRFKDLFTIAPHRKAFLILLLLLTGQQLSGLIAIHFYYTFLLDKMNIHFSTDIALLIITALSIVSILPSTYIVDRFGRKPVFLISSYGCSLCLLTIGTFFLLETKGMKLSDFSYVPLIAILLFTVLFSFGLGPVPSIISSEIFPLNLKSWAVTIAQVYGFVLGLIVSKSYQLVVDAFGYHIIFLAFGGIEFVVAIVSSILMPETSRRSFVEIQQILKMGKANPK